MNPVLVIGNKNYSSWSLRPWLLLKVKGHHVRRNPHTVVPTAEQSRDSGAFAIRQGTGAAGWCRVGLGVARNLRVHCRTLAGQAMLAAAHPAARALARAFSAEMHAGFALLRSELPMNCRRTPARLSKYADGVAQQIERIDHIWSSCRTRRTARRLPVRRLRDCRCDVRAGRIALHDLSNRRVAALARVHGFGTRIARACRMDRSGAYRNGSAGPVRTLISATRP